MDDIRVWVHGEHGRLPIDVASTLGNLIDTAYPGTQLDLVDTRGAVLALRIPDAARGRRAPGKRRLLTGKVPATDPMTEAWTTGFRQSEEGFDVGVIPPEGIAKAMCAGLAQGLDEALDEPAENYLEWRLTDGEGTQYVVYGCRSPKQTPHALRKQAEERRDQAERELEAARHLIATMLDDGGRTVRCQLTNDKGTDRCAGKAAAVKWEDGFRDYVCDEHATNAEARGATLVVRLP